MRIEILGKGGYKPSNSVEEYVLRRLAKPIDIFNPDVILSVTVVLKSYSNINRVEVTMPTKGITFRSEASDADMYKAIDMTSDKLVTQIRKHNRKLKDHFHKQGLKDIYSANEFVEDEEAIKKEANKKLVKVKKFHLMPMTVDEALLEMEMVDHDFYVFLNEKTNKVNVCYRREDGDYALIETV